MHVVFLRQPRTVRMQTPASTDCRACAALAPPFYYPRPASNPPALASPLSPRPPVQPPHTFTRPLCKILEGVGATYVPPRSCGAVPTPLAPTPLSAYSNIIKQLIGSALEMESVMTRRSGIPPNTPKCLGNTPRIPPEYPLNTPLTITHCHLIPTSKNVQFRGLPSMWEALQANACRNYVQEPVDDACQRTKETRTCMSNMCGVVFVRALSFSMSSLACGPTIRNRKR